MSKKRIVFSVISVLAILLFAFALRRHTFNLPHYRGDQHHYVGLAFKLDTEGFSGYNLRGIDIYQSRKHPEVARLASSENKGTLLASLAFQGIDYYDQPLHHMPFGFPAAIMLSHKIFASGQPYFLLRVPDDIKVIQEAPAGMGLRHFRFDPDISGLQFYSIIVPLISSLTLIFLVYMIARVLFKNSTIPIVAAFLMAISPIDILSSQKIWADDMTAALAALAALLYLLSIKKNLSSLAFLGGISCGLSVMTKQMGAIIAVGVVIWHFLSNIDRLFKKETIMDVLLDRRLLLFVLGAVLGSWFWFMKVTSAYGDPLYRPHPTDIAALARTPWFNIMRSRPRHLYLLGIPYQNPLFALSYIAPLWLLLDRKNLKNMLFPLAWLGAAFFLSYNFFTGEHRYMLPAYPAFCISAAYVADQMRLSIDQRTRFRLGTILLIAMLVFSAFWSVPMAYDALFRNEAVIMRPF
jgi:hypothetical protein